VAFSGPTHVTGDVHGQRAALVRLLRGAGLVDEALGWCGGGARLLLMGDFFDRGPDGVGAVDLVMRLQREAEAAGGSVGALLGNHDVLILSAYHFGERATGGPGGTFYADWKANGGEERDLAALTPAHLAWLETLPAMLLLEGTLYTHADATLYRRYGASVEAVNGAFRALLTSREERAWEGLLDEFSEHRAFVGGEGAEEARAFLEVFGGERLVHGHTPIPKVTGQAPETVTGPLVYAGGLCVNVDHGLYLGGPGFVYTP